MEKLKNLIFYLLLKCPGVGRTIINKYLWFVDCFYYARYGKDLTGLSYIANNNGPTPDDTSFDVLRMALNDFRIIRLREDQGNYTKYFHYIAIPYQRSFENYDFNFAKDEQNIVDDVIDFIKDKTAKELSEITHIDNYKPTKEHIHFSQAIRWKPTDRELTEEELRNTQERLKGIIENEPDLCGEFF